MLDGKRVVVTGAAGALGQAVAQIIKAHGGEAIGLDIARDYSSDTLSVYCRVDLTDRSATIDCINALDPFHALINTAGGFAIGTDAAARRMMSSGTGCSVLMWTRPGTQ